MMGRDDFVFCTVLVQVVEPSQSQVCDLTIMSIQTENINELWIALEPLNISTLTFLLKTTEWKV